MHSKKYRDRDIKDANLVVIVSEGLKEPWSAWSECSVTCGGGYRTRTRGPIRIHGTAQQFSACNLQPCGTQIILINNFCLIFIVLNYVFSQENKNTNAEKKIIEKKTSQS